MKTLKSLLLIMTIALFVNSCKKDDSVQPTYEPSPYYLRMTDAPAAYSAVNIDLKGVEITGNRGTVMLNVNAGIYNLLNFSNGLDTLIASGSLAMNRVEQIRLILGTNNTVVSGGVVYPLSTPSAQQSGLKLQVHQNLQPGVAYNVLLDFDANQSIVLEGNGSYSLKPVIRTVEVALSGSVNGHVNPPGVLASVVATSGSNSYSSMVNANGDFMIPGLPAGIYTITVNPAAPYNPVVVTSVVVVTGSSTNIGTINL